MNSQNNNDNPKTKLQIMKITSSKGERRQEGGKIVKAINIVKDREIAWEMCYKNMKKVMKIKHEICRNKLMVK